MACHSGSRHPELMEGANLTPNPSGDSRTVGAESLAGGVPAGKTAAFPISRGGGLRGLPVGLVAERQDDRLLGGRTGSGSANGGRRS